MRPLLLIALAVAALAAAGAAAFLTLPQLQAGLIARTMDRHMHEDRAALLADDALRVAVCGSGSPFPDKERAEPCFLVIAGGRMVMIDAGSGGWSTIARWPVPPARLEAVFLTHFHSDHIADLPIANMQSWVDGRPAPLAVYGGPGVDQVVAGFTQAFAPDTAYRTAHHGVDMMPAPLAQMQPRLIALPDGGALTGAARAVAYDQGGLTITAFAVEHPPVVPAYGYRVDYKGRSIVFSGDTRLTPSVAAAARGADVLIHEAVDKTLIRQMCAAATAADRLRLAKVLDDIQTYHATPAEAAAVGRAAGVKLVVLNHLVPPLPGWMGDRFYRRDLPAGRPPVRVAHDGMLITLPLNDDAIMVTRIADD